MKNVANTNGTIDAAKAMNLVESYTQQAATAARECLQYAGLDQYKHFLDTMYHYTRNTGDKAKEAADHVKSQELKEFFMHFVEEENWHYMLARDDLKAFGLTTSASKPAVVVEFDNFWASLKNEHQNCYLGALFVFENIVKYVAGDIKSFVQKLNLSRAQCRWLSEHNEADLEHGKEVEDVVRKYIADNPAAAVNGAREASRLWINIMQYAFELKKAA